MIPFAISSKQLLIICSIFFLSLVKVFGPNVSILNLIDHRVAVK